MYKSVTMGALASMLALGMAISGNALAADKKDMEKCYGVAKKGMNDCGAYDHACAGQSKKDKDPNEWVYVKKGACERLADGKLKPKKDKEKDLKEKELEKLKEKMRDEKDKDKKEELEKKVKDLKEQIKELMK